MNAHYSGANLVFAQAWQLQFGGRRPRDGGTRRRRGTSATCVVTGDAAGFVVVDDRNAGAAFAGSGQWERRAVKVTAFFSDLKTEAAPPALRKVLVLSRLRRTKIILRNLQIIVDRLVNLMHSAGVEGKCDLWDEPVMQKKNYSMLPSS